MISHLRTLELIIDLGLFAFSKANKSMTTMTTTTTHKAFRRFTFCSLSVRRSLLVAAAVPISKRQNEERRVVILRGGGLFTCFIRLF